MPRSLHWTAAQAAICVLLLSLGGCLLEDAPPASGGEPPGDAEPDPTPPDEGCLIDFEQCAVAVAEGGEDPSVCEPILDVCHEPEEPPFDEALCFEEFEACIAQCDPQHPEGAVACEEQLDACLAEIHPCREDMDPCAEAFEACAWESEDPEACEPILLECEEPPEPFCIEEYEQCVVHGESPEVCEEILLFCIEPPVEPEPECLVAFEECVFWGHPPELCEPILDACHHEPGPPPVDPACVEEYERCLMDPASGGDPMLCDSILDACVQPESPEPESPEPAAPSEPGPF